MYGLYTYHRSERHLFKASQKYIHMQMRDPLIPAYK